ISICAVNNQGSLVSPCSSFFDPSIDQPYDIVLNAAATKAYVANHDGSISVCDVLPSGLLDSCAATVISTDNPLFGLRIDPINNNLYVTVFQAPEDNVVFLCPLNGDGSIGSCQPLSEPGTGEVFGRIAINPDSTCAYLASGEPFVSVCPIQPDGSFAPCRSFSSSLAFTFTLATELSASGNTLYVSNGGINEVYACPIIDSTACSPSNVGMCIASNGNGTFNFSGFDEITNLFASRFGFLYVPNNANNSLSICPLTSTETIGTCPNPAFFDPTYNIIQSAWLSFSK
ncbi:MAG TPA: hypothetical protein VEL47_04505, partial [Myxococcota bacterium]|nr:hypothetical protein [Myxococcota bacterium]